MHGYFNAAHDVNTIISRAIPSRANCMGHELLENAEWKHHLFNTYTHTRTRFSGMHSLIAYAGRMKGDTVAHTYRSVQPSSVIHCDKQLAFHTVQANHSSGHSGDLYET